MRIQRFSRIIAFAGFCILPAWITVNRTLLYGTQYGSLRFACITFLALLMLLRPKPSSSKGQDQTQRTKHGRKALMILVGLATVVAGALASWTSLEWLGVLILYWACLSLMLPIRYKGDITRSLCFLIWMHPLPSTWFATLQTWMRDTSILSSEWFLHTINTRVWADGTVLRTGRYAFEVPLAHSGIAPLMVGLLMALAIGMVRRWHLGYRLLILLLAIANALFLNSLLISTLALLTPQWSSPNAAETFLQDMQGIVITGAVMIVFLEALLMDCFRIFQQRQRERLLAVRKGGLSEYPPFWHHFRQWVGWGLTMALMLCLTAILAWRSRPAHRRAMLKDVAIAMRDRDNLNHARRLASLIALHEPDSLNWRMTTLRMDLMAADSQAVLDGLANMGRLPPTFEEQRKLLKVYALYQLGKTDDALKIMDQLDLNDRAHDPRTAILMAELAALRDDASDVANHLAVATKDPRNLSRIRALYPFLRQHQQWNVIVSTDSPEPYRTPEEALIMLESFFNIRAWSRAADLTLEIRDRGGDASKLLIPYFLLTLRTHGRWEQKYARLLLVQLHDTHKPEMLYDMIQQCMALKRPDLAWQVFRQMETHHPKHPLIPLATARFGEQWFSFRRHHFGLPADSERDTIDLKPYVTIGLQIPFWQRTLESIPLVDLLSATPNDVIRQTNLSTAITRFVSKKKENALTAQSQRLYVEALAEQGSLDQALVILDELGMAFPDELASIQSLRGTLLSRQGAWSQVYETLRTSQWTDVIRDDQHNVQWPPQSRSTSRSRRAHLDHAALLLLSKAQENMGLHLAAKHTARELIAYFPHSSQGREQLARLLTQEGDTETALQVLASSRSILSTKKLQLEADLLLETGRFQEWMSFYRFHELGPVRIPQHASQIYVLPAAERLLHAYSLRIPSEDQLANHAQWLRQHRDDATHGLGPMFHLWLDAYEHGCEGERAYPSTWIATGRDRVERASALHQLTLLLCREGRYSEASVSAQQAVMHLPESPTLWLFHIGLAETPLEQVHLARAYLPYDSHLWLAELVIQVQASDTPAYNVSRQRVNDLLKEALTRRPLHASTLTRASDLLLRNRWYQEAYTLAEPLLNDTRGFLAGMLQSVESTLRAGTTTQAIQALQRALDAAHDPPERLYAYLTILNLENETPVFDSRALQALHVLRRSEPDHLFWPQLLGYIRYERGGWERLHALHEMEHAIEAGATNLMPFVIAADVSQQMQNIEKAVRTIQNALEWHPDHPILLNNLVYLMTGHERFREEALALIPLIEEAAENDPRIRNTIARAYLRNGLISLAREHIALNLKTTEPGSPLWFRCHTYLAEITWLQGHPDVALNMLEQLMRGSRNIPDTMLLEANRLMSRISQDMAP